MARELPNAGRDWVQFIDLDQIARARAQAKCYATISVSVAGGNINDLVT
jgi:hypothetical protein